MSVLDDLSRLSAAEEIFAFLDAPYDPTVLRVARLHILRRMGEYLNREKSALQALDDAALKARCREFLTAAYSDFVTSSPLQERVFKVLKDAVKPKRSGAFIPLEALTKD